MDQKGKYMAVPKMDQIAREVKAEEKHNQRGNVTFRLNLKLYEAFQKACESKDVTVVAAIEKLMKAALGN